MRPYPGNDVFDAEVQARAVKLKAATRAFLRHRSTSNGMSTVPEPAEVP